MRRPSGGGAVYHDLGNLCFTFLTDRKRYDLERQFAVVIGALQKLGITAVFSGRNDLLVAGRKISGNAFTFREESAVHHGTLLVHTDMSQLARFLIVSPEKMKSKGVSSVKARVANLTEFAPDLTVPVLTQTLCDTFQEMYGKTEISMVDTKAAVPAKLYEKYASWQWRFGNNPPFDLRLKERFAWGGVELCMMVREGKITAAKIYSDAMDAEMIVLLAETVIGVPFGKDAMFAAWDALSWQAERADRLQDIKAWLMTKAF